MLLAGGVRKTWFCRLVRLRTGGLAIKVQLDVLKSEFCCNMKFVEGMSQERTRLLFEGARFNRGVGGEYQV